jgi:hypothetical protein
MPIMSGEPVNGTLHIISKSGQCGCCSIARTAYDFYDEVDIIIGWLQLLMLHAMPANSKHAHQVSVGINFTRSFLALSLGIVL